MTWTNVTKAPTKAWTNSNTIGTQQYDDPTLLYDDPNNFYDSNNTLAWTNVPKVVFGSSIIAAGAPMGLLIALTYPTTSSVLGNPWTNIPKAS